MRNIENMTSFLAGLGVGVAASVLLAPKSGAETQTRIREIANRAGTALNTKAKDLTAAATGAVQDAKRTMQQGQNQANQAINDFKNKAHQTIDDATDATKSATGQAVDKSRNAVHVAGEKMEVGGKMLQDV